MRDLSCKVRRWLRAASVLLVLGLIGGSLAAAEGKQPELLLPLGHTGPVTSVALSADGKRVLTGSEDNTARLWDTDSGKTLQTFSGHTARITSVALSADGKRILTGSWDRTARVWNAETGNTLKIFNKHTDFITTVALSADGKHAVTGSLDRTVQLWATDSDTPPRTFSASDGYLHQIFSVAFSEDGKCVLAGLGDDTARLWAVDTGKLLNIFPGPKAGTICRVPSVAFGADGKQVLTGSLDGIARLWDIKSSTVSKTFSGHTSWINCVSLSGDGKYVLTGSHDNSAKLWDVKLGREIKTFSGHRAGLLSGVTSVAFSTDGHRVLTGSYDQTARLWDTTSGETVQIFFGNIGAITSLALSGNAKHLVTGAADKIARLWDTERLSVAQVLSGHSAGVGAVAISADGKRVLTAASDWKSGRDKTARLWDTTTGKALTIFDKHTEGITSVALSADGKQALTGSQDKTARLWDTKSSKVLRIFSGHTAWVTSVALSTDGKFAITGSMDSIPRRWDTTTGKTIQTFAGKRPEIGGLPFRFRTDSWAVRPTPVASAETLFLAAFQTDDPDVFGHWGYVTSVALSADGKRVLSGGSTDRTALLWDAESGKILRSFTGHTGGVLSVAVSGDGSRILTGSEDKTARLYEAKSGKTAQIFTGHTGKVNAVAFGPPANFLVTGSEDGTVSLWKPDSPRPLCSFLHSGDDWLAWTPEGYYTCSPNGENLIAWKIIDPDAPHGCRVVGPEQFRKEFYRPDLFRYLLAELDLEKALAKANTESKRIAPPRTIARALPPNVAIVRPRSGGDLDTDTITVEALAFSVGDHPVKRLRLQVNGRPYRGNLSDFPVPSPRLGEVRREWSVRLEPGEHAIQVIAESAVSEGRSQIISVHRKEKADTLPNLFVLAVGISDYQNKDLHKGVYFCSADARKFADTVKVSSKPLYRDIKVLSLHDREATRARILRALTQVRKEATQRDTVLIFFAGHGKRDDQNTFYFLPVETDLDDLASTGLSEGDFKSTVRGLPGRVVLFLDACHSGLLIENSRSTDGLTDRLYRDLTSNEYGLVLMCAAKGTEVALENNKDKGGYFTQAVLEGLLGKARKIDGAVYFSALDDYVTQRVKELTAGKQHPLTSKAPTLTNIPLTKPE
jgi:WD40 repeat protein